MRYEEGVFTKMIKRDFILYSNVIGNQVCIFSWISLLKFNSLKKLILINKVESMMVVIIARV